MVTKVNNAFKELQVVNTETQEIVRATVNPNSFQYPFKGEIYSLVRVKWEKPLPETLIPKLEGVLGVSGLYILATKEVSPTEFNEMVVTQVDPLLLKELRDDFGTLLEKMYLKANNQLK